MAEILLNALIPSITELCCIVAQIDVSEIKDSSAKSHFHWKTMKCRLIIDTMQNDVIASPVYETIASIHVITSVEFFKSETLQNNLKEMNIKWSAPRPVTPDVYANCLRYSIQFAMAPRWNKVGQYFISDEYFLTFPDNFAMRFNLTIRAGHDKKVETTVKLQPLKIHMYDIKLEDLRIPREIISHFMADPRGIIDVTSYGTFRATVLPSLKRGKLMTILKRIPASSPFKNYGELRRHWKNMYGYRLPKNDDSIIYYDILFPVATVDRFLYPDICVRSQVTERPCLNNCETHFRKFLGDLRETMPLLCGRLFVISMKNHSETNNSTENISLESNESGSSYVLSKTPENSSNIQEFRENCYDRTARMSFSSRLKNQISRESSTRMSPTPSLRGEQGPHHCGTIENTKFHNILTNRNNPSEANSILGLSRIDDCPTAEQTANRGSNVDVPMLCNNDSHRRLDDYSRKMRFGVGNAKKIMPMRVKFCESRIIPSLTSPDRSLSETENKARAKFLDKASTFMSSDETARQEKSSVINNDETVSSYFVTIEEKKTEMSQRTTSPIVRTITLSQKSARNASSRTRNETENKARAKFLDKASTFMSSDETARQEKSSVINNDETVSRYFVTVEEKKTEMSQRTTSPIVRTITLSQKLARNATSRLKTSNDDSMEIGNSRRTPNRPDAPRSENSMHDFSRSFGSAAVLRAFEKSRDSNQKM